MYRYLQIAMVLSLLGSPALAAQRTIGSIDLTGVQSKGMMGNVGNQMLMINLLGPRDGGDAIVTGVGWEINLQAFAPSTFEEANIGFLDSMDEFRVVPGAGANGSGVGTFSSGGIIDLGLSGFMDIVAPGGLLSLEFFETFDDPGVDPDAIYLGDSTLTVEFFVTPEPAFAGCWALLVTLMFWRRLQIS